MKHVSFGVGILLWLALASLPATASERAQAVARVNPPGEQPADARLKPARTLSDAYHPWSPPETREAWEQEAAAIRQRILVSNGLWPMPKTPDLNPVVHGKIDRGDYTVEKVYFPSYPGHYVTGNLYRPKNFEGKRPGVLCPHGHWSNARFYDAGEKNAAQLIDSDAERYMSAAHHHIQARMVQLARMGCIVFHYDMVGYSDSRQIAHREGFTDVEASLRLQNFMGLQTFNSLKALDFLVSLPGVDISRIGVTGASGGGTQTFLLCAIDPRPAVSFPAVMVSTAMQGGCTCENAEYLRIGINNVALAATFAPRPMAMTGANDWTIDIERKGLPELKQVYGLYGQADYVDAHCFPQFPHNYNQVSREVMFDWFNTHLQLGLKTPVKQSDFWPLSQADLTVFDDTHPLPEDAGDAATLREYLTKSSDKQFAELLPASEAEVEDYRTLVGAAARVMLDTGVPDGDELQKSGHEQTQLDDQTTLIKGSIGRKGSGESIPWIVLAPKTWNGTIVFWVAGQGKSVLLNQEGQPTAEVRELLNAGIAVTSADVLLTGEYLKAGQDAPVPEVNEQYVGYTFGYNRPLLSNRVRDILTVVGGLEDHASVKRIHLVGTDGAGPWVLLARAMCGTSVDRTVVDIDGFAFQRVQKRTDPMLLPGALKYGGLGGIAALAVPGSLTVTGARGIAAQELQPLSKVYKAAGAKVTIQEDSMSSSQLVKHLLQ